ncbi:MAG TPA: shikimate dehydrogenase [Acidimicrobiales bacterium]|nr:shikimate dehydrogenase [Acidimicrobiales bacterium]
MTDGLVSGPVRPDLSAATRVVGVMGDPVAHSLSPLLHNVAFAALGLDWVSVGFPVPGGQAAGAVGGVRALGLAGLSVTMPHKAAVAGLVDRLTPVAEALGAVNCIVRDGDRLVGDSTDGDGFLASVRRGAGFDPDGRRCLVVGAGGAARAVVLALAGAGAAEVVVVNRTADRAAVAAAVAGDRGRVGTAADAGDADLVVDATPAGMGGTGSAAADPLVPPDRLGAGQVVADLVYHPPVTPWLAAAADRGATVVGGLGMLVHQAAAQLERWTGQPAPVEAMWEAAMAEVAGR